MDFLEVLHVAHVDVDAADIVKRAACRLHRRLDVLADLSGLRRDVADPAIVPSGLRAVIPEMKTSRPFASITVACEKTPIGFRILSVLT